MFVVMTLFGFFVKAGKPMPVVPVLFISVVLISGVLGAMVARYFSEPMNQLLRNRWGDGPNKLGSIIDGDGAERGVVTNP
jgi:hypothetical protein